MTQILIGSYWLAYDELAFKKQPSNFQAVFVILYSRNSLLAASAANFGELYPSMVLLDFLLNFPSCTSRFITVRSTPNCFANCREPMACSYCIFTFSTSVNRSR